MGASEDIWPSADWPASERWGSWEVRYVAETGSTNTDLIGELERGTAGDRTVLATGHQTAGRGRLDRRWDAPPGTNLLVSIAVAPVPVVPASITHRVGVAAVRAVERFRPDADIALKWPNDVLLDGAKLAGILAQRSSVVDAAVVGLGLNVGWAPEGAALLGDGTRPVDVLRAVLEEIDRQPGDAEYRTLLSTLGRAVEVHLPDGSVERGTATDVDERGRLVVETDAGPRRFDTADVVHLR